MISLHKKIHTGKAKWQAFPTNKVLPNTALELHSNFIVVLQSYKSYIDIAVGLIIVKIQRYKINVYVLHHR